MAIRTIVLGAAVTGTIVMTFHAAPAAQSGRASACNRPAAEAVEYVPLSGVARFVEATADGCWVFGRLPDTLSVLRRDNGTLQPFGEPLPLSGVGGITLTRDGAVLVGHSPGQLTFFDVAKLTTGDRDSRIGSIESPRFGTTPGLPAMLLVTPDDRHLIATYHRTDWLTVVDLDRVRAAGPGADAIVGGMATTAMPGAVRVSPDGHILYMAQAGHEGVATAPASACAPGYRAVPSQDLFGFAPRLGAISVVRISDLVSGSPYLIDIVVDCSAMSIALSPSGDRLYVLAHGRDALLAFDTSPIRTGTPPALVGTVPVGRGPRDLVVTDEGATIVVSHANIGDLVSDAPARLTLIDAAHVGIGAAAVRGVVPTRSHVPSLALAADGQTLFAPNNAARMLQVIDLGRWPPESAPPASAER